MFAAPPPPRHNAFEGRNENARYIECRVLGLPFYTFFNEQIYIVSHAMTKLQWNTQP